jgi:hypothetical protein
MRKWRRGRKTTDILLSTLKTEKQAKRKRSKKKIDPLLGEDKGFFVFFLNHTISQLLVLNLFLAFSLAPSQRVV